MSEERETSAATDEPAADSAHKRSRRERIQRRVARLKDESTAMLSGLEEIRPESRTVSAGFLIFERDREFPTSLLTGALAARIVIFIIPFFMLIIFAVGFGADVATTTAAETAENVGLPEMFAQAAEESSAASGQIRFAGLALTAFAMVWAADSLGRTMRVATSVVWRAPRGHLKRRWLLPLSVVVLTLLAFGINAVSERMNVAGAADDIVRTIVELLLMALLWMVVSRFLPHNPEANRLRDFVPGALLMAIGVIALKLAMVLYLGPKWATLSERYGDIGIVLVLLSYAYLVAFATVASAHVNSAMFYTRRDPSLASPEDRRWPLLDLLREERDTRLDQESG